MGILMRNRKCYTGKVELSEGSNYYSATQSGSQSGTGTQTGVTLYLSKLGYYLVSFVGTVASSTSNQKSVTISRMKDSESSYTAIRTIYMANCTNYRNGSVLFLNINEPTTLRISAQSNGSETVTVSGCVVEALLIPDFAI